jgi:hypothetical protein
MTATDNATQLYHAAVNADNDWQAALNRAGVARYTAAARAGDFAELYASKVATYEAFRIATFPHASR